MQRCSAPCVNLISEISYQGDILSSQHYLSSTGKKTRSLMITQMQKLADQHQLDQVVVRPHALATGPRHRSPTAQPRRKVSTDAVKSTLWHTTHGQAPRARHRDSGLGPLAQSAPYHSRLTPRSWADSTPSTRASASRPPKPPASVPALGLGALRERADDGRAAGAARSKTSKASPRPSSARSVGSRGKRSRVLSGKELDMGKRAAPHAKRTRTRVVCLSVSRGRVGSLAGCL